MSIFGRLLGAVLAPVARPLPPMPLPPNRYEKKESQQRPQFQQQHRQHQHRPQPQAQAQQKRFEVRLDGKSGFAFETGEQGKAIGFAKAQQVKATVFDRRDKRVVWVTLSTTERARPKGQVARIKDERARLTKVSPIVVETGLTWAELPTELLRTFGYRTQAQTAELHRRWQSSPLFRKLMEEAVVLWQWRGLMRRANGTRFAMPEMGRWEGNRYVFTATNAFQKPAVKQVKAKKPPLRLLAAPKVAPEVVQFHESLRELAVLEAVLPPEPQKSVEPIVASPVAAPREKSPAEIEAEELAKLEAQIAEEEAAKRKKAEAEEKWLAEEIAKEEAAKRVKELAKLDPRTERRLNKHRSQQGQAPVTSKPEPVLPVKVETPLPPAEPKREAELVVGLVAETREETKAVVVETPVVEAPVVEAIEAPVVETVVKKVSRRKAAEGVTGEVMRAWRKELGLTIVAGATLVGVSESTLRRMK